MNQFSATVKSVAPDGGSWVAVCSAPTLDRDGEVIDAKAFEPLPAKVPVHDCHGGELVGSARPYYRARELYVEGRFATTQRAQDIRALVTEGHLETMSIVFFNAVRKNIDGVPHITRGELLAVDWAPIASNRDTRVLQSRSVDAITPRQARKFAMDLLVDLAEADLKEIRRLERRGRALSAREHVDDVLRTLRRD